MTNTEQHILTEAEHALERATGLAAEIHPAAVGKDGGIGAVLELIRDHRKHRFLVQVKAVDRFETPTLIKATAQAHREPTLLVAPYITREVAERCRQLHLSFIDTAGNAFLEAPGLLVYVVGNTKPAKLHHDRFRALNPAGLQVAFALACRPVLVQTTYRQIAERAGVALGTVGPVMKDLEARGYLQFRKGADRKLLNPERLIEEWATHYPVTLRPKLNPRRFQADNKHLQQVKLPENAYWGGEPAAERLTRYLKPAEFTIYAREPIAKQVSAGRMRADPTGNVEILDAFWNFDADTAFPDVVPPLLAYADLLATHDDRNVEAARMIYEQRIAPAFHSAK